MLLKLTYLILDGNLRRLLAISDHMKFLYLCFVCVCLHLLRYPLRSNSLGPDI